MHSQRQLLVHLLRSYFVRLEKQNKTKKKTKQKKKQHTFVFVQWINVIQDQTFYRNVGTLIVAVVKTIPCLSDEVVTLMYRFHLVLK